jgi:GDP-D-mannose dehydratase
VNLRRNILIVGSNGQDGQVLQEILKEENASLFLKNRNTVIGPNGKEFINTKDNILKSIFLSNDIDEVYFLAATNFSASQKTIYTNHAEVKLHLDLLVNELIELLEIICLNSPKTKIFFASSALIFGNTSTYPQDEMTLTEPTEIYALFKVLCQEVLFYYRNKFDLFIVIGILYPHESEFRKPEFLFPTIIHHAYLAKSGHASKLELVDLDFRREWNCAYQVMQASVDTLRLKIPDNYIVGSGIQYSVSEICSIVFGQFDLNFENFVFKSSQIIRKRNPNLIANPVKLFNALGSVPDGNAQSLIQRVCDKLIYT